MIWLYTLRYHSIGLIDFFLAVLFSACCVYPNSLCILCCLHSKSAIISEIMVTPIKFQICVRRTALTSIQLTTESGSQFSNESRVSKCGTWRIWCSVWLMHGLEWKRALFNMQNAIDHRRRYISIRAFSHKRILWIFTVTKKNNMIIKIKSKFIVKMRHFFQNIASFLTFTFHKVV